ncbi:MAG TPA: alpha/beta hydrolase [Sphingomonas sp.]|nr:alpha/beta hydrolase [Sphingomonas sp.]
MNKTVLLAAFALAACHSPATDTAAETGTNNSAAVAPAAEGKPVWLHASDNLNVKGTYYQAKDPKAIILLFHQAGSSKDEYKTIAPKLVAAGYSALAIDQRAGGDMYGTNETAEHMPKDWKHSMEDAQSDMDGAVRWAQPIGKPIILWGSSYSASLAIPLANNHPGTVKAVLSFSPGEYFTDAHRIGRAAALLDVPIFITSAATPDEEAKAKAIAARVPDHLATLYVPTAGVHGSSTLIAAKDPQGAKANWDAVMAFLGTLKL